MVESIKHGHLGAGGPIIYMKKRFFVSALLLIAAFLLPASAQTATDTQTQTPTDAQTQPAPDAQTQTAPDAQAQTVADAQKEAVVKYPDLAIEGSPLHTKFLELYHQAQNSDPTLLSNPDWPLILSDKAYALLAVENSPPAPSAAPSAIPSPTPAPSAPPVTPAPAALQPAESDQTQTSAASTVGIVKDCVDIIFFIVAGAVVVLTFNRAKKSIFMPLRTETFKLQLKAIEDVLLYFEKRALIRIDDEFDLDKIVYLNAIKMLDDYVVTFFGNQFKKEEFSKNRGELFKDIAGEIATKDFAEHKFQVAGHFQQRAKDNPDEAPLEPGQRVTRWNSYEHGVIYYTKAYQDATERLRRFNASPLLPKDLKALISEFEALVSKNLQKVGSVLTEVAKELPIQYPTFAILGKADLRWIWKKYIHARVPLEEKQNAVLAYLERYLQIDDLLERGPESLAKKAEPAGEAIVKPAGEPIVKPVAEPIVKPVAEPVVKPVAEPIVKLAMEPIGKPTGKS
jgi:hypothetical protein